MKQKRVYIIHGWEGRPEDAWFPWLKSKLEKEGFEVFIPAMPNTEEPTIDEWVNHLLEIVPSPNEDTYFIGHSIGCQAILRYLEKLNNKKIGGAVFVSGWFILKNLETKEEWEIADPWINTPIDFEKVKSATHNFIAVFSDNDPFVPLEENKKLFSEKLNAEIIIEKNKGHFTGEDGVYETPSVLQIFSDILKQGK
ncbi:MAG: alpha/beta hydrolase [Candidatus Moranbacteria bacterium]|nr:alpha/beta hydrolase [Candidatus Moranbacteria bacterium]